MVSEDPITPRVCDTTRNLLMSSGAGCGKTYRMVERYEYLVQWGVEVPHIVAVTFTEKAANELKGRVREKCQELAQQGGADAERWREAARQLELAPIGTIHSFCARLLRENALAANVDPHFQVLDERQQVRLLRETLRETLLARVRSGEPSARLIVARWELAGALKVIEDAVQRRESHRAWLQSPPDAAELLRKWHDFAQAGTVKVFEFLTSHADWLPIVAQMTDIEPNDADDKAAAKHRDFLAALAVVKDERRPMQERLEAFCQCLQQAGGGVGSKKNWADRPEDLIRLNDALKQLTAFKNSVAGQLLKAMASPEDQATAELAAAVCAEGAAAIAAYDQAKREGSLLDFDDLEIRARDLLRDHEDVRRRVQGRYEHVLVDEFQDTNALQKEIIWFVAGGDVNSARMPTPGKLFIVGDDKQSIYRFRGADVTVFTATQKEFATAENCDIVRLRESRRSIPGIVDFHNELFSAPEVMGGGPKEIYEAEYNPLCAWRGPLNKSHEVELLLVEKLSAEESPEGDADEASGTEDTGATARTAPDAEEARRQEARALAARIAQMVEQGESLVAEERVAGKQQPRPVRYGDIAILFRAMTDVAIYEGELRRRGIPYYTVAGRGFYNRQEIRDCLSILRTIENASDSLALAAALRSPAFALSDEALFWLTRSPGSLWQALEGAVAGTLPELDKVDKEQRSQIARAHRVLAALRADKNHLSVAELVERVLRETGLAATLLSQFGGRQSAANLTKLTDLARDFEASGEFSLREFIDYLSNLVVEEERESLAAVEAEAGDVVKLLTIHKAKGMQWPVVVVPDLGRAPNRPDIDPRWSPQTGPVPKMEDEKGERVSGAVRALLKDEDDLREEAEDRRLFYVALTRAEDHLILSSSCKLNDEGALVSPGQWLGWLAQALNLTVLPNDGEFIAGKGWRLRVLRPWPGAVTTGKAARPARAEVGEITRAVAEPEAPDDDTAGSLRGLIEPVRVPPAHLSRVHVTALTRYHSCPRAYWLRYVLDLPEALPAHGWLREMSGAERGDLAHKVLELVGREGVGALDRALELAAFPGGLSQRISAAELDELAQNIRWFLEHEAYAQWVASAARLRSEVEFSVVMEQAIIEGKIDALVEDAGGLLRVLDYKTGASVEHAAEYHLQIGLYCAAVRAATGALPAGARLVHLDARRIEEIPLPQAADRALQWAAEALEGIRKERYSVDRCPHWGRCGLAYACEVP